MLMDRASNPNPCGVWSIINAVSRPNKAAVERISRQHTVIQKRLSLAKVHSTAMIVSAQLGWFLSSSLACR
jgi:hypothetical protein